MDSRSTPTDIRRLHLSDEFACFSINRRSARMMATTNSGPVEPKAFAVPAHNRIGVQRV